MEDGLRCFIFFLSQLGIKKNGGEMMILVIVSMRSTFGRSENGNLSKEKYLQSLT